MVDEQNNTNKNKNYSRYIIFYSNDIDKTSSFEEIETKCKFVSWQPDIKFEMWNCFYNGASSKYLTEDYEPLSSKNKNDSQTSDIFFVIYLFKW